MDKTGTSCSVSSDKGDVSSFCHFCIQSLTDSLFIDTGRPRAQGHEGYGAQEAPGLPSGKPYFSEELVGNWVTRAPVQGRTRLCFAGLLGVGRTSGVPLRRLVGLSEEGGT